MPKKKKRHFHTELGFFGGVGVVCFLGSSYMGYQTVAS
jgi:hypothetical protein